MANRRAFYDLMTRVEPLGVDADTLEILLRCERTLQRWAELECGDGNDFGSWAIERDETSEKPFMVRHHYGHGRFKDYVTKTPIADRETAALKQVQAICKKLDIHFYHQGDPRGCALYIHHKPLAENNYTQGVAISL